MGEARARARIFVQRDYDAQSGTFVKTRKGPSIERKDRERGELYRRSAGEIRTLMQEIWG